MNWAALLIFSLCAYWLIDMLRFRKPLNSNEVLKLAYKRRRGEALREYSYSIADVVAHPNEKKSMNGKGEIVKCDLDFRDLPARIAGLLKYKKHEWIVFAFSSKKKVKVLWWNKGPNKSMVVPFLDDGVLLKIVAEYASDTVVILHNHPNPFSRKYHVNSPSNSDLVSARYCQSFLKNNKLNLLEFICERGAPTLYYAAFNESFLPINSFVDKVLEENGKNILKNRKLRKEMKRRVYFERINGK